MTTPRVKHGDQFPHEVKLAIAQCARQVDVARLARVSSSWNAPAEETLWRDLRISAVPRGWEGWRSRLQALRTRPIRQKYLRTLTVPSSERSLQAMADLIELCRYNITEIKQIDIVEPNVYRPRFAPCEAWALARAIDAVRVLPALTKLSLQLGETWESDLHRALSSVPALVDLEVITYGIRELVVSVDARPTLRLRHLSRFALTSVRWEAGMKMVLAAAPPLTEVILDSRHDEDAYTVATGAMDKIIKCNTLSRLEVYDGDASGNVIAQLGSASGAGGRGKLEQLQELSLCHPFKPDCLFKHLKLTVTTLYQLDSPPLFRWYCGTLPTVDHTGLIAPWFITLIKRTPQLRRLTIAHLPRPGRFAHDDQRLSFRVGTYSAGDHSLYIVSADSTWTGCPLGPASMSFWPPRGKNETGVERGDMAENSVLASSGISANARDRLPEYDLRYTPLYWLVPRGEDDRGIHFTRHPPVTLTFYRGHALPTSLLRHVAPRWTKDDCSPNAAQSLDRESRGMTLSDDEWTLLQEWYQGVSE